MTDKTAAEMGNGLLRHYKRADWLESEYDPSKLAPSARTATCGFLWEECGIDPRTVAGQGFSREGYYTFATLEQVQSGAHAVSLENGAWGIWHPWPNRRTGERAMEAWRTDGGHAL